MNDEVAEFLCKEECDDDQQAAICLPVCDAEGADQPIKPELEQVLVVSIEAPDESEPSFHVNNGTCDEEAYGGMLETRRKQDEERNVEKLKRGSRGFALGSVSDKIVPWLRARFERKEGGKTAIQEVIKLYAFDFPRDSIYFPLESFQVGQLVRQAFPNIELCKVTNADRKRLRCYKNLYRRDVNHGPTPIFSLNAPKKRIIKQPVTTTATVTTTQPPIERESFDQMGKARPSQMNSAVGSNFTTYRSRRLEQKLSEIAAQKVIPGTGTKRGANSTTNGTPTKVLVISQPMMIKVPKTTTKKLVGQSPSDDLVPLRSRVSPSSIKKKQSVVCAETTSLTKNESSSHLVPVNSSSPPPPPLPSPPASSSSTSLQQHRGQDLTPEQQSLLADLIPKRTIKETARFDQIRHQLNQVLDVVELSQLTPDQLNQLIHLAKTRFSMMAK